MLLKLTHCDDGIKQNIKIVCCMQNIKTNQYLYTLYYKQ